LEQALRIALLSEANTAERVIVKAVEAPKVKDYKARSVQSAMSATSAVNIDEATVAVVTRETTV